MKLGILFACTALASSCISTPPPVVVKYHTVEAKINSELPLVVDNVTTVASNRPEILIRQNHGLLDFSSERRWEQQPSRLLTRALKQSLSGSSKNAKHLSCELLRFEYLSVENKACLVVKYQIVNPDLTEVTPTQEFSTSVDCGKEGIANISVAMNQAINELVAEIVKSGKMAQ